MATISRTSQGPDRTPDVQVDASFSFREIARILQVPVAELRKWRRGQYKAVRKFLTASGEQPTGFYLLEDLYMFALVHYLRAQKFPKEAIERAVEETFLNYELPCECLCFRVEGNKWHLEWRTCDVEVPWNKFEAKKNLPALSTAVTHEVDVKSLIGWVNGRVAKVKGKV